MTEEKKEVEVEDGTFICPRCGAELDKQFYERSDANYVDVLADVICPNEKCDFQGYLWYKCMGISETKNGEYIGLIPLEDLVKELQEIMEKEIK